MSSHQSTARDWKTGLRLFYTGSQSFKGVKFLRLKLCASSSSSSQNTELEYRLPFSLSSGLPYWSINRQVVRLKSSPICSQGPNWSWRSGEVYFSIGLLSLWIQQQWWTRPCACVVLLSCFLLPFSISKPVIFIFHDILHNKFKCLLSSSNQTVGDILEKKWNKMLCD